MSHLPAALSQSVSSPRRKKISDPNLKKKLIGRLGKDLPVEAEVALLRTTNRPKIVVTRKDAVAEPVKIAPREVEEAWMQRPEVAAAVTVATRTRNVANAQNV